tara:strand:+ start:99 stop:326 length:228 start_codon:yes stop_codon:yes gene_type:complete
MGGLPNGEFNKMGQSKPTTKIIALMMGKVFCIIGDLGFPVMLNFKLGMNFMLRNLISLCTFLHGWLFLKEPIVIV